MKLGYEWCFQPQNTSPVIDRTTRDLLLQKEDGSSCLVMCTGVAKVCPTWLQLLQHSFACTGAVPNSYALPPLFFKKQWSSSKGENRCKYICTSGTDVPSPSSPKSKFLHVIPNWRSKHYLHLIYLVLPQGPSLHHGPGFDNQVTHPPPQKSLSCDFSSITASMWFDWSWLGCYLRILSFPKGQKRRQFVTTGMQSAKMFSNSAAQTAFTAAAVGTQALRSICCNYSMVSFPNTDWVYKFFNPMCQTPSIPTSNHCQVTLLETVQPNHQ